MEEKMDLNNDQKWGNKKDGAKMDINQEKKIGGKTRVLGWMGKSGKKREEENEW